MASAPFSKNRVVPRGVVIKTLRPCTHVFRVYGDEEFFVYKKFLGDGMSRLQPFFEKEIGMARKNGLECDWLFVSDFGGLLSSVPSWVKKGIARRIENTGKIVLVSAVCPDYARGKKGFTYISLSDGIPYLATQHLRVVQEIHRILQSKGIPLEYHITLADTEFDLPMVVKHMADGDVNEFVRRCQSNCDALFLKAQEMGLPILTCRRFLDVFPDWFSAYGDALQEVERELETEDSVRHDLINNSFGRELLYQAMTAERVDSNYCVSMAKRQWAQYMAWGMLAESMFGNNLVMMNHDTPNLGRVNHAFVRKGRESAYPSFA